MSDPKSPLKLLVDTNVWLDYYLHRNPEQHKAYEFICEVLEHDVVLYVPTSVLKDVSYLIALELKRATRQELGELTESAANAAAHTAWGCIVDIMDKSLITPCGYSEALHAISLRSQSMDFEDNLLMACCTRSGADYLVSSDEVLKKQNPELVISIDEALERIAEL